VRVLIRWLDGLLRRAGGVFEFCADGDCVLRLQRGRARHDVHLPDGAEVRRGEPVLLLHLWNERVPPIRPEGPDLAWAVAMRRMLARSLREVARWLAEHPGRREVRAIGGATVLAAPGGGERLFRRLGFEVFPYHSPLGRFGEFWENMYTWWLMWAFNNASLRSHRLLRLRRAEVWISVGAFLERYG